MMRMTHMVGPASGWTVSSIWLGAPPLLVLAGIPVAAYGGLVPDIDSHVATITRSLGFVTHWIHELVVATMGTHRRGAHSLIMGVPIFTVAHAALVIPLAIYLDQIWPLLLLLPLLVGIVSHPLLDFWTGDPRRQETAGCCLFWPLSRKRWGIAVMRTNQVVTLRVLWIWKVKLKLEPAVVRPVLVIVPFATLIWRQFNG